MRSSTMSTIVMFAALAIGACGGSSKPAEPAPVAAAPAPPPPPPACSEAPANPADALAKEPQVLSACMAGLTTGVDLASLCGQAKIAFEIGKDGRVTRAEVASSTLPVGVTDCIKGRLAALQYACPKAGTAAYTLPVGLPSASPTGGCPGFPAAQ